MKVLAADIGGTSTRLIYAEVDNNKKDILAENIYYSYQYENFNCLFDVFVAENNINEKINKACFAVAGPVKSGEASVTNLPWSMTEAQLSRSLNIPRVKLINDFIAVAHGVAEIEDKDLVILQQGTECPVNKDAAVVGAGTGLGASHLIWNNGCFLPKASEAGHAGFAPCNQLQCELLNWLQQQHTHVSVEMLLSGRGLKTIYQFLHEIKHIPESLIVKKTMRETDPAQVISEYALAEKDLLCQRTLDCFIEIYGAAAGDIVLHYYPVSELYIAGGIAAKIQNKMTNKCFINAFTDKGPMSSNMKELTVKLVSQEKTGLYGALSVAAGI